MNWVVTNMKWIMIVSGALTCTMIYALVAPQAALRTTFGRGSVQSKAEGRAAVGNYFGFLRGSFCPHYDGEKHRRPEYHRLLSAGLISDGWAADDSCALHFVDGALHAIVSSRKEAHAYRVTRVNGLAQEVRHEARYLGA